MFKDFFNAPEPGESAPAIPFHARPHVIFASAIALLLLGALGTGWTIYRLYEAEQWVHHGQQVELMLGLLESDLGKAGRYRTMFVGSGDTKFLQSFADARNAALSDLAQVTVLTSDNSEQEERCGRLADVTNRRLGVLEKAIDLAKSGNSDAAAQDTLSAMVVNQAAETAAVSDEMRKAEQILLQRRTAVVEKFFRLIVTALSLTFALAVFLIWEHYRRLEDELQRRTKAEHRSQGLSLQLLRTQDEERRRISRELHDGLGQSLSAAKMIADSFAVNHPEERGVDDLVAILDESLSSTRTMSYLLHPPLLDEIGLASAAEWFVNGFSQRTGINVSLQIKDARRLPPVAELTLFRVLQESLTNIQRHAQTSRAEVSLNFERSRTRLWIQDHGVGIPAEKLGEFDDRGISLGLGLTGMKHRVQEQGGTFHVLSGSSGTTIRVELPGA